MTEQPDATDMLLRAAERIFLDQSFLLPLNI
jgi:hypothetical protein